MTNRRLTIGIILATFNFAAPGVAAALSADLIGTNTRAVLQKPVP